MCKCIWVFLSIKQPHFLSLVFPLWGENLFLSLERKHLSPSFIFFPLHPTKYTLKKFSFSFSFKVQSFSSTLFHLQTNTPLELTDRHQAQITWCSYPKHIALHLPLLLTPCQQHKLDCSNEQTTITLLSKASRHKSIHFRKHGTGFS